MKLHSWILASLCGLLFMTGANAAGECRQYMLSGTYLTTASGWATVATSPIPIFAPVVVIGVMNMDDSGNLASTSQFTNVVGGQTFTDTLSPGSKLTVNDDCTVTFKASCAGGCSWEGTGYFNRSTSEIDVIFTKAVGYPLTLAMKLKQISK